VWAVLDQMFWSPSFICISTIRVYERRYTFVIRLGVWLIFSGAVLQTGEGCAPDSPCGRLNWLPVSFLLQRWHTSSPFYCTLNTHYRIVCIVTTAPAACLHASDATSSCSLQQLNSTHSLMRKDLTGHIGPNGHLHMPIVKLKKLNKTNMQHLW